MAKKVVEHDWAHVVRLSQAKERVVQAFGDDPMVLELIELIDLGSYFPVYLEPTRYVHEDQIDLFDLFD